jgi:hypothetical protein
MSSNFSKKLAIFLVGVLGGGYIGTVSTQNNMKLITPQIDNLQESSKMVKNFFS